MGDPPPRRGSLVRGFLAALLVVTLCSPDAAATSNEKIVAVIGAGECTDCASRKIKNADAFNGLHVAINCKAREGEYQIRGVGKLDKDGKFTVKLPSELVKEDGQLKAECFAQLHGGAKNAPCPAAQGLEAAKLVLRSRDGGKHTFGTAGKLSFSSETCAAAFLWYHPWFKPIPKYPIPINSIPPKPYFPPKVYPPMYKPPLAPPVYKASPTPVYTTPPVYSPPPTPVYQPPPVYKPPPTPVYTPPPVYSPPPTPVYQPAPPVYKPPPVYSSPPVYKPAPPVYSPPPVYKPPPVYTPPAYQPPTPVYKPPPVYTPPAYQPPTAVYVPPPMYYKPPCPPIYIYKPPIPKIPPFPPVYMKPLPPFPPKYFYPHPKFGYPPSYGWPPISPYPASPTYNIPKHPFFPPRKADKPKP